MVSPPSLTSFSPSINVEGHDNHEHRYNAFFSALSLFFPFSVPPSSFSYNFLSFLVPMPLFLYCFFLLSHSPSSPFLCIQLSFAVSLSPPLIISPSFPYAFQFSSFLVFTPTAYVFLLFLSSFSFLSLPPPATLSFALLLFPPPILSPPSS